MLDTTSIQNAKHILLKTNNNSFANASALYTYLLTLHKKVTLFSQESIAVKFSFLPWFQKLKFTNVASADLVIDVHEQTLEYFLFFKKNEIKINKKMATALYGGLLVRYENFRSPDVDGIVFAMASELIELGAEHKLARHSLIKSNSLAFMRLKARLYASMSLECNATELELLVSDEDLAATGASLEDAVKIMHEFLDQVHVRKVFLKKSDNDMKILKIVEDKEFEK